VGDAINKIICYSTLSMWSWYLLNTLFLQVPYDFSSTIYRVVLSCAPLAGPPSALFLAIPDVGLSTRTELVFRQNGQLLVLRLEEPPETSTGFLPLSVDLQEQSFAHGGSTQDGILGWSRGCTPKISTEADI
jgi:hypothetical protein